MDAEELDRLLSGLSSDFHSVPLDSADRAMLDYVFKLTRTPNGITADDVQGLREEGFDDLGIHDICSIAAYFAFVNRVADGLGVELETRKEPE